MNFKEALDEWMKKTQDIVSESHKQNSKVFKHDVIECPKLTKTEGPKYIRIIEISSSHRSAFCFIDKTNGDVLKAATWERPAKHARGNIFTEKLGVDKYGGIYLK